MPPARGSEGDIVIVLWLIVGCFLGGQLDRGKVREY